VVSHLLQPLVKVGKGRPARYIVDEKHPDGLPVVSIRDCAVPLLASGVPNLSPDERVLHLNRLRCELHSNRHRCLPFKLVFRVSKKQLRLPHFGVANEHQLEHEVMLRSLHLTESLLLHFD
jgi:hypothetical protein